MARAIGDAKNIDLNSANEQELESVGGLGRERAARIVQRRPLRNWDDVKAIEGFGDKLVEDLRSSGATLGNNR
jgi:DNA uptake protein ComE-like DNA-binding protein